MSKFYMIQELNTDRTNKPIPLYATRDEAEKVLYSKGYQVTSNPWLGTVYSKVHKDCDKSFTAACDARIIVLEVSESKEVSESFNFGKALEKLVTEIDSLKDMNLKQMERLEKRISTLEMKNRFK